MSIPTPWVLTVISQTIPCSTFGSPNRRRYVDIRLLLFLASPTACVDCIQDHALRKYQHLYFLPVCSFLYASWRLQSFQYAWATVCTSVLTPPCLVFSNLPFGCDQRNYFELAIIAFNYSLLATLPWPVAVGSILFGGFLVGVIVTATHQSEDLLEKYALIAAFRLMLVLSDRCPPAQRSTL